MTIARNSLICCLCIVLASCGGDSGDSSSGGGSEPASNPLAGTYTGTQNFTITVTGAGISASEATSATFRLDVNSAGNIATVVDQDFQAAGSINNGSFSVSADTTLVDGTLTCTGVITYTGTVGNGSTSGTVSATYLCSDTTLPGIGLAADISGTFSATRQNAKQELNPAGVFDRIREAVSRAGG